MRLSNYFLPVLKETPADATIASHKFMLRAGMIKQDSAGIYIWLPLGFKVLKKIEQIFREEQNRAGAVEMLMPTIQSANHWKETCLLYTSPSPRDGLLSRMPSSA